jgi:hypothetical protein
LSGNPGGAPNPKVLDVAAGGTSTIFDATGPSDFIPNWVQHSVSFTGTGNSTTITFASNTQPIGPWPQNDAFGPVVGDISLTSTTPEPGFYGLLALGLSGLLVAVTRRPRAKSPADRE